MTDLEDMRAVYVKARALVAQGWAQGWFVTAKDKSKQRPLLMEVRANPKLAGQCNFDMIGAIVASMDPGKHFESVYYGPMEHVIPAHNISVWNDTPGRTQDEVVAMFDKAIRYIDKQINYERDDGA